MALTENIFKIKFFFPFQWEYGYGEYGLGCYLYLWDDVTIFIKETEENE